MNPGDRYRIHMGCGESLQSRWWITRTDMTLSSVSQKERSRSVAGQSAAGQSRARCRS